MARREIEGTPVFDGDAAMRGYPLNAMCFSFNHAANRASFAADETAYCDRYGLTPAQRFATLKFYNETPCDCGCPHGSYAKCKKEDPGCPRAPKVLEPRIQRSTFAPAPGVARMPVWPSSAK